MYGTLGGGDDTSVFLYTRGGKKLLTEIPFVEGSFTRTLDETSEFHLTALLPGGDCCDQFKFAYQWATEIAVYRDGGLAWVGPLVSGQFGQEEITLDAADLSSWYGRRTLGDHSFTNVDLIEIWRAFHNDIVNQDPSMNMNLITYPSGVTGTREVLKSDFRYGMDEMQELARTELDWTAYGRNILVGGPDFIKQLITLGEEEWETFPSFIFRGEDQATTVVVKGENGIVAEVTDERYEKYYGRLVRVFDESQYIKDYNSAVAAAKTRLELLKDPIYVDPSAEAVLRPCAGITLDKLIPGSRVRISGQGVCRDHPIDFRLQRVTVQLSGEVSVQLQTLGSVDESSTVVA